MPSSTDRADTRKQQIVKKITCDNIVKAMAQSGIDAVQGLNADQLDAMVAMDEFFIAFYKRVLAGEVPTEIDTDEQGFEVVEWGPTCHDGGR